MRKLEVADEQPDGAIFVIPVKLEDCELPARLQKIQAVNLREATGYDRLLRALRSAPPRTEAAWRIPDEQSVARAGMIIKVVDQVYDEYLAGAMWNLYQGVAGALGRTRIDRSLLFRSEFDELLYDPRVSKYLTLGDDGTLLGFATLTNDLESVPSISPAYFEAGWFDHYREKRIWICDLAAARSEEDSDAYRYFFEEFWLLAGSQNGIIGVNRSRLPSRAQEMLRDFEKGAFRRIGPMESTTYALYDVRPYEVS